MPPPFIFYSPWYVIERKATYVSEDPEDEDRDEDREVPDGWQRVIHLLPPIEQDIIEMTLLGMTQRDIGYVLGHPKKYTQPAMSYRWRRAIARIRALLQIPDPPSEESIQRVLAPVLTPECLQVCLSLHRTASLAGAARAIGRTQNVVRRRFAQALRCLSLAADLDPQRVGPMLTYMQSFVGAGKHPRRSAMSSGPRPEYRYIPHP